MTSAVRRGPGSGRGSAKWISIALFLLPAFALYGVLVLLPIVQAAYYSVFRWNGLKPLTDFVGLANYEKALSDPVFIGAVSHNVLVIVLSLAIQIPFALALALMLNRRFRGRAIMRLIFFAPFVISGVITAIVFQLILLPDGLADRALEGVGLGAFIQGWLADPSIVMLTMFVIITWMYFGFHMILLLAGL